MFIENYKVYSHVGVLNFVQIENKTKQDKYIIVSHTISVVSGFSECVKIIVALGLYLHFPHHHLP